MKIVIDARITYNDDKSLRRFMAECWKDIAIAHPEHSFVCIATHQFIRQPSDNLEIYHLPKTSIAFLDKFRLQRLLKKIKADRLITLTPIGFTVQSIVSLENKIKQVCFTGSVPENASQMKNGETEKIIPAFKDVITSLTWAEAESVRTTYSGGNSFFLFIGNINESHQLIELLKAFSMFKKWQQSSMQLLLVGHRSSWTEELEEKLASYKYKQDVAVHTNLDNEETARLVAASYALLYPASGSAFPFAMLWAAQAGKAIIATDAETSRQISATAIWVEPQNTMEGFAKSMILLYKDEAQQQTLIQQIKEQSANFSRQQMLNDAWKCIEQ